MLLITGITGLTGRFLLAELRKAGYMGRIRCLVRVSSDVDWIADNDLELFRGDVSDTASVREAADGAAGVIHVAHIHNSRQITRACLERGIRRVLFVNTTGVFSKFRSCSELYRQLEKEILESGLDYTIVRPTMIYGNQRDRNIHKLVRVIDRFPIVPVIGRGTGLMQPIYARDLAQAIAAAYIKPIGVGKAYNVAGRSPLRYIELLRAIVRALGKKRRFVHVPYSIALAVGLVGNHIPNGLIDLEKVQRLTEDKVFDYSDAERDLGFSPISFEEGIVYEVAALRKCGSIS
ncbi:MAG: NAD-dependent epimerase/dehydratase family protein [Eubacteriales bacterium]|nr:NAD-dependent epimerase/dehydratase family protein [Eubacteriales bacterium]